MQFAFFTILIHTVIVVDTIGHIGAFLNFSNQDTLPDAMYRSCRNKICIALVNWNLLQMLVQCSGINRFSEDFLCYLMLKAVYKTCTLISINDIPHFGLTIVSFMLSCILITRMNLNGQVFLGIDELNQNWKFTIFYLCTEIFRMRFQYFSQCFSFICTICHIAGTVPMNRTLPGFC